MDMNKYLERFMESEAAEYPLVDMTSIVCIAECIDQGYSLEQVKLEVNSKHLSNTYTAIMMSDFRAREKENLIKKVETYKGIYRFQLSEEDDPEENMIYAAFPDPISAFQFSKHA
jgi:hypothetical protein